MKRIVTLIALAALAGCGDSEPQLSESQTTAALGTLSAASSVGYSAALEISAETGQATVTALASCLGGGTVEASGRVQVSADTSSFELDLTYSACVFAGTTIDGVLSYAGSASSAGTTFSMSGDVSFSGQIEGRCKLDIEMSASAQAGTFTIEGNACGNKMSGQFSGLTGPQ